MCVSMFPADLTCTVIYIGEAWYNGRYVHVLGYQNKVQNRHHGPNAMILHFPTSTRMTSENLVDTEAFSKFLDNMVEALTPRSKGISGSSEGSRSLGDESVQMFKSGIYDILMCSNASSIPSALGRVSVEKRPQANQQLFDWYAEQFPNHTFALCCFNNSDAQNATPLLWYYEPTHKDTFSAPGIDAHTGGVPMLDASVDVDHWLIVGSTQLNVQRPGVVPVWYSQHIQPDVRALLPTHVMGRRYSGRMANGDFIIPGAPFALAQGNLDGLVRATI